MATKADARADAPAARPQQQQQRQHAQQQAARPASAPAARPAFSPPTPRPRHARAASAARAELLRYDALERLRAELTRQASRAGCAAEPLLGFERWRFACKAREEQRRLARRDAQLDAAKDDKTLRRRARKEFERAAAAADALLPQGCEEDAELEDLVADLVRAGAQDAAARAAARAMVAAAAKAHTELAKAERRLLDGADARLGVAVEFHRHSVDFAPSGPAAAGGRRGARAMLTREAYCRLAAMHRQVCPAEAAPAPAEEGQSEVEAAQAAQAAAADNERDAGDTRQALHLRLLALLLRYKAIRGHGFQAAVGPPTMQLLRETLGVRMELFASPLNARLPAFCSAFPDVDAPFGSCGSAWALGLDAVPKSVPVAIEINPPFVESLLDRAAKHAAALLAAADQRKLQLTLVAFYPGWENCAGWQALKAHALLRHFSLIAAADHGFCDGASHQRRDLYRASPYDTGVFVLQSRRAAALSPLPADLEDRLRESMAQARPSAEAAARQVPA